MVCDAEEASEWTGPRSCATRNIRTGSMPLSGGQWEAFGDS